MTRGKDEIYRELLAIRCRRGEPGALEELVRTWESRLYYFIRRFVDDANDACDVLQQTWLKVLRGVASLKDPSRLAPWLYQVARNACLNHGRTRAAYHEAAGRDPDVVEAGDPPSFDRAEDVHRGLQRLAMPHREVLTLHFLEGMPVEQIAEVVGVPAGTVKSRLHHAKRALRAAIIVEGVTRHE